MKKSRGRSPASDSLDLENLWFLEEAGDLFRRVLIARGRSGF
jgi:hypothetical protein